MSIDSIMFSCGDDVEKIMTEDQYRTSKYAAVKEGSQNNSPLKGEAKEEKKLIESYFPEEKAE